MHTSGYKYAVKNGYKKSEKEYLDEWYEGYKSVCARCGIWPADYDDWLLIASAVSEVSEGES